MKSSVSRHSSILAIFIAASAVLGIVKVPSPVGSIALDSLPGYFVAGFYGPVLGAIVGSAGHVASAATGGFPLGPLHIAIAIQMLIWCALFGWLIRRINKTWGVWLAAVIAALLNGLVAPFMLIPLGLPSSLAWTLLPFLFAASALNIGLASVAIMTTGRLQGNRF